MTRAKTGVFITTYGELKAYDHEDRASSIPISGASEVKRPARESAPSPSSPSSRAAAAPKSAGPSDDSSSVAKGTSSPAAPVPPPPSYPNPNRQGTANAVTTAPHSPPQPSRWPARKARHSDPARRTQPPTNLATGTPRPAGVRSFNLHQAGQESAGGSPLTLPQAAAGITAGGPFAVGVPGAGTVIPGGRATSPGELQTPLPQSNAASVLPPPQLTLSELIALKAASQAAAAGAEAGAMQAGQTTLPGYPYGIHSSLGMGSYGMEAMVMSGYPESSYKGLGWAMGPASTAGLDPATLASLGLAMHPQGRPGQGQGQNSSNSVQAAAAAAASAIVSAAMSAGADPRLLARALAGPPMSVPHPQGAGMGRSGPPQQNGALSDADLLAIAEILSRTGIGGL